MTEFPTIEKPAKFVPLPDITPYELAIIVAKIDIRIWGVGFEGLPDECKRHFTIKSPRSEP